MPSHLKLYLVGYLASSNRKPVPCSCPICQTPCPTIPHIQPIPTKTLIVIHQTHSANDDSQHHHDPRIAGQQSLAPFIPTPKNLNRYLRSNRTSPLPHPSHIPHHLRTQRTQRRHPNHRAYNQPSQDLRDNFKYYDRGEQSECYDYNGCFECAAGAVVGLCCSGEGGGEVGSGVGGGSGDAEEVGGVVEEGGFRGDDWAVFD